MKWENTSNSKTALTKNVYITKLNISGWLLAVGWLCRTEFVCQEKYHYKYIFLLQSWYSPFIFFVFIYKNTKCIHQNFFLVKTTIFNSKLTPSPWSDSLDTVCEKLKFHCITTGKIKKLSIHALFARTESCVFFKKLNSTLSISYLHNQPSRRCRLTLYQNLQV